MAKPIITLTHHGSFSRTEKMFERLKNLFKKGELDHYGELGVMYLEQATPKDTGTTAASWYYEIHHDENGADIVWRNSNIQNGVEIAIILQYGHATRNGGYVTGIDYINPALRKIFRQIAKDAQKEVRGIL